MLKVYMADKYIILNYLDKRVIILVFEKLSELVANQFGVDKDVITRQTSFVDDLNADSVDLVELLMSIEDEFDYDTGDMDLESIKTVGEAEDLIKENIDQD